jgi:hypothetical protein
MRLKFILDTLLLVLFNRIVNRILRQHYLLYVPAARHSGDMAIDSASIAYQETMSLESTAL